MLETDEIIRVISNADKTIKELRRENVRLRRTLRSIKRDLQFAFTDTTYIAEAIEKIDAEVKRICKAAG